jgi:hypothetical protein
LPRPPNYSQERKDRERIKAAKKAEKQAAKGAERERLRGMGIADPKAETVEQERND